MNTVLSIYHVLQDGSEVTIAFVYSQASSFAKSEREKLVPLTKSVVQNCTNKLSSKK